MIMKTSDITTVKPFLHHIPIPAPDSHKGQNGRLLVIGGSHLFHAASLWAAEISSHFVDMVHYSSVEENNEIFLSLKKQFRNGMVIHKKDLLSYVEEDDTILLGPGMVRSQSAVKSYKLKVTSYKEILDIKDEAEYTYHLTKYLLEHFPHKKFVIDAGALQMMEVDWLKKLQIMPIITPHQREFKSLFNVDIQSLSSDKKKETVKKYAHEHNCLILLKAIADFISDGDNIVVVQGGNAGLTKGGTGDILAGLAASLYTKSNPLESAVLASFILKKTADNLFQSKAYWYNISDIINNIPETIKKLIGVGNQNLTR